jgi:hypothetical protein
VSVSGDREAADIEWQDVVQRPKADMDSEMLDRVTPKESPQDVGEETGGAGSSRPLVSARDARPTPSTVARRRLFRVMAVGHLSTAPTRTESSRLDGQDG